MRRLADVGEHGLIARIARRARRAGPADPAVRLGIGDDAAVLRPRAGEEWVVSTDALVEGVHFRWRSESPRTLGRRALAAALSDLAAMGARPLGVTVALAAPAELELARFDGLVEGLLAAGRAHGCPLVGGNLARSGRTALTLTVLGAVGRGRALTRAGARPGDSLWVTGTLGRSALERARAESGRGRIRHVPLPRLRAGRALAALPAGACIDVSDGLLADLGHLLRASGVGAELDPARVPRAPGLDRGCRALGLDALRLALTGGEDYELLFTLRPGAPSAAALSRRLGVRVTQIGRIGPRGWGLRGVADRAGRGWEHF